jgi:hypothetical protein
VGLPVDPDLAGRPLVTVPGGGIEAREVAQPGGEPRGLGPAPLRALVPRTVRRAGRERVEALAERLRRRARGAIGGGRQPRTVRWSALDDVVARHRTTIRELAEGRTLAKDPRFTWTLGVWAAAGAPIDHVLVCVRELGASIESRVSAGHIPPGAQAGARDAFVYGLGLCFGAIHDHHLDHGVAHFPELVDDPNHLFATMRFPEPVTAESFRAAFERVTDRRLVHDWS